MKIAVLDLGTNTFHLLVAAVKPDRSFKKIFRSKVVVKLGEGAIHRNTIAEIPYARGIHALHHYAGIINQYQPDKIFAFATSAIRSAKNGEKFVAEAKRETGIEIDIISGDEEAELIYHGVKQCVRMTDEHQLIMDIGGGSTEFIIADRRNIVWKKSFDIGASRLLAMFRPSDPIAAAEVRKLEIFLSEKLLPLDKAIKKFPVRTMIGSSGSFDSLAEMIGWN